MDEMAMGVAADNAAGVMEIAQAVETVEAEKGAAGGATAMQSAVAVELAAAAEGTGATKGAETVRTDDGECESTPETTCTAHEGPKRARTPRGKRNAQLGRRGEDAAARFLDRRGYEIVERNWTCSAGEADIIARDGETVVFVEVKTRTSCDKGLPSEAVDERKRDRYERIAALFLRDYDVVDVPVRFDIVALLVIGPDRALIRHHIDAFSGR